MMKAVAVSALSLLGVLYISGRVEATSLQAGALPCGDWDCQCAFSSEKSCCCVEDRCNKLTDDTTERMLGIWSGLNELQNQIDKFTKAQRVAFAASFSFNSQCFGPHTNHVPIPYNSVSLNDGNGFNPAMGIFTAPVAGSYSFSFTASCSMNEGNRIYYHLRLMLNGSVKVSVWEDNRNDPLDSATQNVLLSLEHGDQVYVELQSGRKICQIEYSEIVNVFSGFMIYPD